MPDSKEKIKAFKLLKKKVSVKSKQNINQNFESDKEINKICGDQCNLMQRFDLNEKIYASF